MIAGISEGTNIRGAADYVIFDKESASLDYEILPTLSTKTEHKHGQLRIPRIPTNNQPYAGQPAPRSQAKSLNDLRNLSSGGLVRFAQQPQMLLQGDALGKLEHGKPDAIAGLRRPGYGRAGAGYAHHQERLVERPHRDTKPTKKQRRERGIRGEFIAGTLGGSDATGRDIARESAPFRRARADIKAPVVHISLALHPEDGSKTPEQWKAMSERFLELMEFPKHGAWTCYRHKDTKSEHVHLLLLRSVGDGKLWDRARSVERAIRATEQIEIEFGLHRHSREKATDRKVSRQEEILSKRMSEKGHKLSKQIIREAIDLAVERLGKNYTIEQLREVLKERGVSVDAYTPVSAKGEIKGLKFEHGGVFVQAGQLGASYKAADLFERGLNKFTSSPAPVNVVNESASPSQTQKPTNASKSRDSGERLADRHHGVLAGIAAGLTDMALNGAVLAAQAIAALINALIRLFELITGAKEGSLARIDTKNLQLRPARMIPTGEPGSVEQQAAMSMAQPTLERAAESIERKDILSLGQLPVGNKTAVEALPAEMAAVAAAAPPVGAGSARASESATPAPQPQQPAHHDAGERINGMTRAEARMVMRDVAIRWLRDRQVYLSANFGGETPELRQVEQQLTGLKFTDADEKKYQDWLAQVEKTDETHDEYILSREREYLTDLRDYIQTYDDPVKRVAELEQAQRRLEEIVAIEAAKENARARRHERERG